MTDKAKPAAELEVEARAINATDWEPLSGMVKKRCSQCRYSSDTVEAVRGRRQLTESGCRS
jgi:hypothetical protein